MSAAESSVAKQLAEMQRIMKEALERPPNLGSPMAGERVAAVEQWRSKQTDADQRLERAFRLLRVGLAEQVRERIAEAEAGSESLRLDLGADITVYFKERVTPLLEKFFETRLASDAAPLMPELVNAERRTQEQLGRPIDHGLLVRAMVDILHRRHPDYDGWAAIQQGGFSRAQDLFDAARRGNSAGFHSGLSSLYEYLSRQASTAAPAPPESKAYYEASRFAATKHDRESTPDRIRVNASAAERETVAARAKRWLETLAGKRTPASAGARP